MKKYNTPEMVVAKFDKESVLTESTGFATYDAFVENNKATTFEKDFTGLITFSF